MDTSYKNLKLDTDRLKLGKKIYKNKSEMLLYKHSLAKDVSSITQKPALIRDLSFESNFKSNTRFDP